MHNRSRSVRVLSSSTSILVGVLTSCDPSPPEYASPFSQGTTLGNGTPAPTNSARNGFGGNSPSHSAASGSRTSVDNVTVSENSIGASGSGGAAQWTLPGMAGATGSHVTVTTAVVASSGGAPSGGNGGAYGGSRTASTSASRGPVASPSCTGKAGTLRGKSTQSVTAAGVNRTFIEYVPDGLDPDRPAPIVIVPHGWLMSAEQMYVITKHNELAEREGFVVLYPDGEPVSLGPWNVGEAACASTLLVLPTATGDDQAFVDAMVDFVEADQCVDRAHVFMTGFSMGGYFSNETGCLRSEMAAVGPHSGGSHDLTNCPSRRKPVILFHGTADGLIPVTCGKEARDRWVTLNECSQAIENRPVKNGHCEYSQGCPTGGQVVLCLFDGMDHGWAGGADESFSFPEYESAAELGWSFFKTYAW